jgi:hypothetical protein
VHGTLAAEMVASVAGADPLPLTEFQTTHAPTWRRAMSPRRFPLRRQIDMTGISGEGDAADGVQWSDGTVALRWRARWPDTTVWEHGMPALVTVHGHAGTTTDSPAAPKTGAPTRVPPHSRQVGAPWLSQTLALVRVATFQFRFRWMSGMGRRRRRL